MVRCKEMMLRLERLLSKYFNSWWVPSAACLVLLAAFTLSTMLHRRWLTMVSNVLFGCLAVAFIGILSAGMWNLFKKRWANGVLNVVMLLLCGGVTFAAMSSLMFALMFGPSEDGFADHLIIPANIEIAEPLDKLSAGPGKPQDLFQQALLEALVSPGDNDSTITASAAALTTLEQNAPEVLRRYLAASPSWRVFREHGHMFATRRWMMGSEWRYQLHGYYTKSEIDAWSKAKIPDFQFRFTIGFSDRPWWRGNDNTTRLKVGDTARASLAEGNRMYESHCVIAAGALVIEAFEQSGTMERRLTKAALAHLDRELAPLAAQPTEETIRAGLPPHSIRPGELSFELMNSFQPGIYDSIMRANPGEPGMLYLKAVEVTTGTPLSVDRLKEKSNEWIGWSANPAELFFSNTNFTIYEGDWGKPYAARFEVWFTPDAGGSDRKLMEKVFKIEGWQR